MSDTKDTAVDLLARLERRAPELIDLMRAETPDEYDQALDLLLERAVSSLERNAKNFENLDEEGLSAALALALSMPGLRVEQEGHSNGHADLIIEALHWSCERRTLAEAKIYNGPKKHVAGLEQLLTRYTTGREGRGLLIEYYKDEGIKGLVEKIRQHMDFAKPMKQVGSTADHKLKWSFASIHTHLCGENLQIVHIGCNLCTTAVKSAVAQAV